MPEKGKKARQTSLDVGENTLARTEFCGKSTKESHFDLRVIAPGNLPVTLQLPDAAQYSVPLFLTESVSNRDMYRRRRRGSRILPFRASATDPPGCDGCICTAPHRTREEIGSRPPARPGRPPSRSSVFRSTQFWEHFHWPVRIYRAPQTTGTKFKPRPARPLRRSRPASWRRRSSVTHSGTRADRPVGGLQRKAAPDSATVVPDVFTPLSGAAGATGRPVRSPRFVGASRCPESASPLMEVAEPLQHTPAQARRRLQKVVERNTPTIRHFSPRRSMSKTDDNSGKPRERNATGCSTPAPWSSWSVRWIWSGPALMPRLPTSSPSPAAPGSAVPTSSTRSSRGTPSAHRRRAVVAALPVCAGCGQRRLVGPQRRR